MPTRRFDNRDFNVIADSIVQKWRDRKNHKKRRDLEKDWKEIDRQLRMEPDLSFKQNRDGTLDPDKAWMPEKELPLQKQALEILVADARRMIFPAAGPWFSPHVDLSDEYLQRVEGIELVGAEPVQTGEQAVRIAGENDPPSRIDQDNADKLLLGLLNHNHRQYDFRKTIDKINAESFKYGTGIGRGRVVTKEVFLNTTRGVVKETQKIPMLVPRSIKQTYLDDTEYVQANEGHVMGPLIIFETPHNIKDLQVAANKGSKDPDDPNGGWMPANLKGLDGDKDGNVILLEAEGDLLVPRKTVKTLFIPGVIVTIVHSMEGKGSNRTARNRVIRWRFRQTRHSSYVEFPYHIEDLSTPYATSPLTGGMHIQRSAVHALNIFHQTAELHARPPVSYDKTDAQFAQEGGPIIEPGRLWASFGQIAVHLIGDPVAMQQAYLNFLNQYAEYTGILPARIGAQTVSHTTAFAKDAEIQRGAVRTVDYVADTLSGALTKWLYMEFELTQRSFEGEQTIYLDPYKSFVTLNKGAIPDQAVFEVFGAGGPQEQAQRTAQRLNAVQQAIQIDAFKIQAGMPPSLDYDEIQRQILAEGGWTDVDTLIAGQGAPQGAAGQPPVEGDTGDGGNAAPAQLQAIG